MKIENKFSMFLLSYRNLGVESLREQEMLWEHKRTCVSTAFSSVQCILTLHAIRNCVLLSYANLPRIPHLQL